MFKIALFALKVCQLEINFNRMTENNKIYPFESSRVQVPKIHGHLGQNQAKFLGNCFIMLFPFMNVSLHAKNQTGISKILGDILDIKLENQIFLEYTDFAGL